MTLLYSSQWFVAIRQLSVDAMELSRQHQHRSWLTHQRIELGMVLINLLWDHRRVQGHDVTN